MGTFSLWTLALLLIQFAVSMTATHVERSKLQSGARRTLKTGLTIAAVLVLAFQVLNQKRSGDRMAQLEEGNRRRSLNDEQQVAIGRDLRPFEGQRINVHVYRRDPEAMHFSQDVAATMVNRARWTVSTIPLQSENRVVAGILVEVKPQPEATHAAAALAKAFLAEGLAVTGPIDFVPGGGQMVSVHDDPLALIRLTIGKKP